MIGLHDFHDSAMPKIFQILSCNLEITCITPMQNLSSAESFDVLEKEQLLQKLTVITNYNDLTKKQLKCLNT